MPPGAGRPIILDKHYAAIGKVVDAWADLEFQVGLTIWDIIREELPIYVCVTAQMVSILPKLDALISTAGRLGVDAKHLKAPKSFRGRIGEVVKERNRAIHDRRVVWVGQGNVARFEVSAKGGLKFEPVPESGADLLALRVRIGKKLDALTSFATSWLPQFRHPKVEFARNLSVQGERRILH